MTTYRSDIIGTLHPPTTASQAGLLITSKGVASLNASHAASDLVQLCKLPAGHVPIDFQLEVEALDGGSAIKLDVGVLNSGGSDLVSSTNLISSDTTAQSGGTVRADQLNGLGLTESDSDRIIAAKITSAASTATSGFMRGKLTYCDNP